MIREFNNDQGFSVKIDKAADRVIVTTPNDYDVFNSLYFKLDRANNINYATKIAQDKNTITFAINQPLSELNEPANTTKFNQLFREMLSRHTNKQREFEELKKYADDVSHQKSWDRDGQLFSTFFNWGVPVEKLRDANGAAVMENGKAKVKPSFVAGEVVKATEFYVLMGDARNRDDVRYFRAIPTQNLLEAKELRNRAELIKERFPVGVMKFLGFDSKYKLSKLTDYQPKQAPQPQKENTLEAEQRQRDTYAQKLQERAKVKMQERTSEREKTL
ncbi:hypothetical protein PMO31116_00533 [Pandoraea morbifera]|uniref:Uncharacterized protein n=1 Tax=Pandoraea morbifera TaxID=2508300 RepID=A0A5E4S4Y6_9BURK|nr:hypothetical protein [Pandoraea morbifera]VVD69644.1 hypothetical protein PMO31116_00533 [Pandoraea morbifera]